MSTQEERFAQIAAAIRVKDGTTAPIKALDFAARILAIPTGGGSADFAVPLVVTVDTNAEVTATTGDITVTGTTDADNIARLILTAPGVWMVTAKQGDLESSKEVEVIDGYDSKISLLSRLPTGYTEVEFIQTDSKCSINTNFKPNRATTKFVMELEYLGYTSGTEYVFATQSTSSLYGVSLTVRSKTTIGFTYYTSSVKTITASLGNDKCVIEFDGPNGIINIGGSQYTVSTAAYQASYPIYIGFPAYWSTNISAKYKLYSFKIYTNNILECDFVPCINPDGVAGLYDLVNSVFYKNENTGVITPGPAV